MEHRPCVLPTAVQPFPRPCNPISVFELPELCRLIPLPLYLLLPQKVSPNEDGTIILDKKDSLTEKDSGWIPSNPKGILKIVSGNPHKVYPLKLMKGDNIVIRLKSNDRKIDPLVALEDSRAIPASSIG